VIGFTSAFRGCIPVLALRLPSKPLRSLPSIQEPCSPPSSPRLAHLASPSTRNLTSPSSHPHLALNSHLTLPLTSLITSCRANLALDPHRDDLAELQEPRGRANHALDPQHDDLAVEQQSRANLSPTSSKNPGKIYLCSRPLPCLDPSRPCLAPPRTCLAPPRPSLAPPRPCLAPLLARCPLSSRPILRLAPRNSLPRRLAQTLIVPKPLQQSIVQASPR
jgi:hypothetical protein